MTAPQSLFSFPANRNADVISTVIYTGRGSHRIDPARGRMHPAAGNCCQIRINNQYANTCSYQ